MFPRRSTVVPQADEIVAQTQLTQQVEQFEKKLVEQQRKDKEQRQSEQIKMQIQLRDFEQQLVQQQRRDYEFQQREHEHIREQVRDYVLKVQQGKQERGETMVSGVRGAVIVAGEVQQQVKDFERMLVEKLQQDVDRRQRVHMHILSKLKEFERILCEQQQGEYHHLIRNAEQLAKLGLNSSLVNGSLVVNGNQGTYLNGQLVNGVAPATITGQSNVWLEKQQVLEQQTQEEKSLKLRQEKLHKLVKEIESEINARDIEQQKRELNVHFKVQQVEQQLKQAKQVQELCGEGKFVGTGIMTGTPFVGCGLTGVTGVTTPFGMSRVEQIQQLESQLVEYKRILREKLREQQYFEQTGVTGGVFGRQGVFAGEQQQQQTLFTIEWIKTLVQKLKEVEIQLIQQEPSANFYFEKKFAQLKNHIGFFEQITGEPIAFGPCQSQLYKLRDLLDYELLIEKPTQALVHPQQLFAKQLCQEIVSLIEDKINYCRPSSIVGDVATKVAMHQLKNAIQTGESIVPTTTTMSVERLWRELRNIEYQLRDLRREPSLVSSIVSPIGSGVFGAEPYGAGYYVEPISAHWQQLHKKIYQLEQQIQLAQPIHALYNVAGGVTGRLENVLEQMQVLECLVQETRPSSLIPLRYQVVKHVQQKQLIKRLYQVIDEIECQVQEVKQAAVQSIVLTPTQQYQIMMVLKQLRQLKSQLKCVQQQLNLVVMHQRMVSLVGDYERQVPRDMFVGQHQIQLQQITHVLKCLEQQLVECAINVPVSVHAYPLVNGLQGIQQIVNGSSIAPIVSGYFGVEEVVEQLKQQFVCQKQLQQALKDFYYLIVAQKQVPTTVRFQTQQVLLQQLKEFEQVLAQCGEVIVDQEQFLTGCESIVPTGQFAYQPYHHQQLQTLMKQLQHALVQQVAILSPQHALFQYVPYQQHQSLLSSVQQLVQQQLTMPIGSVVPGPYTWYVEQQQKQCIKRLQQHLRQLQQIQTVAGVVGGVQQPIELLQQQQQHILLQQIQQQLQQLAYVQQQQQVRHQLPWAQYKQWPAVWQQQLKQQQHQVRVLAQQIAECEQLKQWAQQKQFVKSATFVGQPISGLLEAAAIHQQQQQLVDEVVYDEINNNNVFGVESTVGVNGIPCYEDIYLCKEEQQEALIGELVQKYIACINMPGELTFRRKFEQLYFENSKFGQLLRMRVKEISHLRKQFEELQAIRFLNGVEQPAVSFVAGKRVVPSIIEELLYEQRAKQQFGSFVSGPWSRRSMYPVAVRNGSFINECMMPTTTTTVESYESLPTMLPTKTTTTTTTTSSSSTLFGENGIESIVMPTTTILGGEWKQPVNLKCVEQLLNQLENKLTQLRIVEGIETEPATIAEFAGKRFYGSEIEQPTIQIVKPVGQASTVIEVTTKKQHSPSQTTTTTTQLMQSATEFKICPVCGIAVEKELSQPEFELHVNSHFPFTE